MLEHLIKACGGIVLVLGLWLAVLNAYRRVFHTCSNEDVLAGRTVCRGLGGHCACKPRSDSPGHS